VSAVKAADAEQLASMVTDDVVVVHGDGRCIRGKDELKADFCKAFESFSLVQTVTRPEFPTILNSGRNVSERFGEQKWNSRMFPNARK
jgi:ketosteroid isomerase-like protein